MKFSDPETSTHQDVMFFKSAKGFVVVDVARSFNPQEQPPSGFPPGQVSVLSNSGHVAMHIIFSESCDSWQIDS